MVPAGQTQCRQTGETGKNGDVERIVRQFESHAEADAAERAYYLSPGAENAALIEQVLVAFSFASLGLSAADFTARGTRRAARNGAQSDRPVDIAHGSDI